MPQAERRLEPVSTDHRQLPRQHVVEHLAALPEAGLDEPPQVVLGRRRQAARDGLAGQHRGVHDGAGSNAAAGTTRTTRTPAWYCTKTER